MRQWSIHGKIAVALHDELGRVPTAKEIEQVLLLTRVMYKTVLGLHYRRDRVSTTARGKDLPPALAFEAQVTLGAGTGPPSG